MVSPSEHHKVAVSPKAFSWVAITLFIAFAVAANCDSPDRSPVFITQGDQSAAIRLIEAVSFGEVEANLKAVGALEGDEHIFHRDGYENLPCTQIISVDMASQIGQEDNICPSLVVDNALGFDLIIAYRDGTCPIPPVLNVESRDNQILFEIRTEGDRGICDLGEVFRAAGINIR